MSTNFERIILVTRKTRLEGLVEQFNTRSQVKFCLESAGANYQALEDEDDAYRQALEETRRSLQIGLKLLTVERGALPTLSVYESDLVVVLGQDGLVANTAKYIGAQPLLAVNPDPARYDGILLPFVPSSLPQALERVLERKAHLRHVTLAKVTLQDGQSLLAFNDFLIGAASHISARYRLKFGEQQEAQSSSGILVSTGVGASGWLSSVFNMAGGLARAFGGEAPAPLNLGWDDQRLVFSVREPFRSKHSSDRLVAGVIDQEHKLVIESEMPQSGVIFSDGVEADFLQFNAGASAHVGVAEHKAALVAAA
jgi:NAD kinase